ncbi:hypothetical protein ANMWB30_11340 [Arthrobacter sp. MWB30]|nr:hypothetical protein ANMWB30_11340 [Arthrobacter sp. MWB30]
MDYFVNGELKIRDRDSFDLGFVYDSREASLDSQRAVRF